MHLAQRAIQKAEETYGCVVSSVVTDGAANMVKMRKLLRNQVEEVVLYGCASHGSNLLAKSICKLERYQHILNQTNRIVKYFTYHQLPNGWYRKSGGQKLVIPKQIRWNTYSDHLKSYINNYATLLKVCIEHEGDAHLDSEIGIFFLLYFYS